jgi:hypothetical protein
MPKLEAVQFLSGKAPATNMFLGPPGNIAWADTEAGEEAILAMLPGKFASRLGQWSLEIAGDPKRTYAVCASAQVLYEDRSFKFWFCDQTISFQVLIHGTRILQLLRTV